MKTLHGEHIYPCETQMNTIHGQQHYTGEACEIEFNQQNNTKQYIKTIHGVNNTPVKACEACEKEFKLIDNPK